MPFFKKSNKVLLLQYVAIDPTPTSHQERILLCTIISCNVPNEHKDVWSEPGRCVNHRNTAACNRVISGYKTPRYLNSMLNVAKMPINAAMPPISQARVSVLVLPLDLPHRPRMKQPPIHKANVTTVTR
jgi:hypothetical protein